MGTSLFVGHHAGVFLNDALNRGRYSLGEDPRTRFSLSLKPSLDATDQLLLVSLVPCHDVTKGKPELRSTVHMKK